MRKHIAWVLFCMITVSMALIGTSIFSHLVTVMIENNPVPRTHTIVIDAGHGGIDGGATSCTGLLESRYNLEISLRLNDFLHLLGYRTTMIRTSDISVYTDGSTIAAQKRSDLQERVRIVNSSPNAILVSIHQNYFQDSRYSGAVVLYAPTDGSDILAKAVQGALVETLTPGSKRQAKMEDNVYLMKHIQCPGILVECGFLSHPEEEARLRDPSYQKKLIGVIGCTISGYLSHQKALDSKIA